MFLMIGLGLGRADKALPFLLRVIGPFTTAKGIVFGLFTTLF